MFQLSLTPAAGKRLIARAIAEHPVVIKSIKKGIIVIIAGTTNGYVAEELLKKIGQSDKFRRARFFRGIVLPPKVKTTGSGRLPDESKFPGDVVIKNGTWQRGKTIFDVIEDLKEGDVIMKGANCINLVDKKAGVLIGHPKGGTIATALQAVVGKRVKLLLPVGLEKRIPGNIDMIASLLNASGGTGPRLLPVPGEIITEIQAIELLSGAKATLVAGGGVCGAEGAVWLALHGEKKQLDKAKIILHEVTEEAPFAM